MSEDTSNLEESTELAYEKLLKNMPSIGFINRKKRIKAYIQLTEIAQYMITSEELTEEGAMFILSIMMRKCANFQKATMMSALSLNTIGKNILSPIGLKFALEVRRNLNLASTHHSEDKPPVSVKENE